MPPEKALMTVAGPSRAPSLDEAADQLGVAPSAMDGDFGVISIDPSKGLYVVQVESEALFGRPRQGRSYDGPFSNPKIEPLSSASETGEVGR